MTADQRGSDDTNRNTQAIARAAELHRRAVRAQKTSAALTSDSQARRLGARPIRASDAIWQTYPLPAQGAIGQLGMTYEQLWLAYAASGGGSSPAQFMAFVWGTGNLAPLEIGIIHHVVLEELTARGLAADDA